MLKMKSYPFTREGFEEMTAKKPIITKKNLVLGVTAIAYISIIALQASTGTIASMGSVEDSLIKAFFTKPPVGL
jgi:hypothetical protein